MEYLAAAGIGPDQYASVSSWSGALLAWAAIKSGLVPPVNPSDPLRWLEWGSALTGPQPGSVVILTEGAGRPTFLCGVAARVQARKVYVVGAFDRSVQTRAFPIEQVISARRSPGSTAAASTQIVIEHEAAPSAAAYPATYSSPAVSQLPPPSSAASSGVEKHHLESMLTLFQEKFRQLDSRIDTVQSHAIGAVKFTETA
jgi:hypothetical protein